MPLRTRLKRAFTRGSQDEGSLSKTSSKNGKKTDPNIYQPGEKMPPMKYRRPVNPEHKKNLEAFSFSTAWRRRSDQSLYSPMGSRMPSRKASRSTLGRKSMDRRRMSSRGRDAVGIDSGFGGSIDDEHNHLREGSDEEGDITNVGLSRNPTQDPRDTHRKSSSSVRGRSNSRHSHSASSRPATATGDRERGRRSNSRNNDQPFTQEELELALKRSHLEPTKAHLDTPHEQSDESGRGTPGSPGAGKKTDSKMMDV